MDEAKVTARLAEHVGWKLNEEGHPSKKFIFEDFGQAWQWLSRVAVIAEENDHHPDIFVHWNEVTLTLYSHDVDSVTGRDFRLIKAIDDLN
jgi:4a-hydroxytetrahydrobiopterin dehydratase